MPKDKVFAKKISMNAGEVLSNTAFVAAGFTIKAVLLDCGDTLVDEGTEIKDEHGVVLSAELIPGAKELLVALKTRGYKIALVADGFVKSFETIFKQHKLEPYFDALVISESLGVEKPDARMFQQALAVLGLESSPQIVMVGNNLSRDILGANLMGLSSVWLDWAPRRAKIPATPDEIPDHIIKTPLELISVLETIKIELAEQTQYMTAKNIHHRDAMK